MARFLRSVLPIDWLQVLLLFGIVCLFIAKDLRWWPLESILTPSSHLLEPLKLWQDATGWWRRLFILARYLTLVAGSAGYFICLWPGNNPVRRMVFWVCAPALTGLGLISGLYLYLVVSQPSAPVSNPRFHIVFWVLSVLWKLGPGIHFGLLGFVLVGLFTWSLARGFSSLPLALPESTVRAAADSASWHRLKTLLWLLIVLLPTVFLTFPGEYGIYYVLSSSFLTSVHPVVLSALTLLVVGTTFVVTAVLVIGKEGWYSLRRSVRLPKPEYLALGAALSVAIALFLSFGHFMVDRFYWDARQVGKFGSPDITNYFRLPDPRRLWLLPVALPEEILFRGLLQPRFIRRYGLLRGIFLVGFVFAAVHFSGDFSGSFTDGWVILKLCTRLSASIPLSFVAGWLTLRTGSVIPAALAHGVMNILIISPFGPTFPGIVPVTGSLWTLLAFILFRYWPVQGEAADDRPPNS